MHKLLEDGFLKIFQIIGDPKAEPPIPAIVPVSKSTWWAGCKSGRFPKPVKIGNGRGAFWKVEDIRALIASARGGANYE